MVYVDTEKRMVALAAQFAMGVLGAALLAALLLWVYKFLQYREQVRLSQARWLTYEPGLVGYTAEQEELNWPMLTPMLLSPIPEERLESGRVR